jgi:hypothetical protein
LKTKHSTYATAPKDNDELQPGMLILFCNKVILIVSSYDVLDGIPKHATHEVQVSGDETTFYEYIAKIDAISGFDDNDFLLST